LWQRDKIDEPLICLPTGENVPRIFQEQLRRRGVDWFPSIEASSTDLIEAYVANGLGVGVSVAIPQKPLPARVCALSLDGFPRVVIGALWRRRKTPLLEAFLNEVKLRARRLT
jgi:DNA-binding transcriptional LysR family regulator